MPIIVKGGSTNYEPCPDDIHVAVCVDVVDLGEVETHFGKKHKVKLVWEVDELTAGRRSDGKLFLARKQYTASLNDKSTLYKDLTSWRGRPFTDEELRAFDLEKLIGVPCRILVEHVTRDGQTYANVTKVTKAGRDTIIEPSGEYVREINRPAQDAQNGNGSSHGDDVPWDESQDAADDASVPF